MSPEFTPEQTAEFEAIARKNGQPEHVRELTLTPYSTVTPESPRWAWQDRVPLGAVTLLAGRQGLGKSTLLANLAAGLSRGTMAGDLHGQPVTVLTASYEDTAPLVVPRLTAAGADTERVYEVGVTGDDGHPDLLSLPGDLSLIAEGARERGARAVLVDPLMAAMSGGVDSHRDQDVRRALAPLGRLAEELDLAVVAVLHLRKGSAAEALDRVSGSVAFTAAARSVLAFGKADDDEDSPQRVLAHAKSNLGPLADALGYAVTGTTIDHDGRVVSTVRLDYQGEVEVEAGELLSPPASEDRTEVEIAVEWLEDELADGQWRESREIKAAAKAADIRERTLKRAKQKLGVEADRFAPEGSGGRGSAVGHWRLPIVGPQGWPKKSGQGGGPTTNPLGNGESGADDLLLGQDALSGPTKPPCGYAEHRSTDWIGHGGQKICGTCHPPAGHDASPHGTSETEPSE